VSTGSQYEPVPCPKGLTPDACEAINAWGRAWSNWAKEVMAYLGQTSEWAQQVESWATKTPNPKPTGVAPPPPPPPPKDPPPEPFTVSLPGDLRQPTRR
jgi:hypothetical protein